MAIKEQDKVFYEELANGDKVINLPVTRANNVEGLGRSANTAYVVGDVVYVDNNKKVALKCITGGTTSNAELDISTNNIGDTVTDGSVVWQVCNRTSDVTSVNGKTGDVVVDLPVGHMYWSVEPNVPAGRLPALGATYNRALYADLWAWANEVGLVKSESEWQAIASANDGNCAYYSDGDGSTTFRVPSIKCWVTGASSVDEVGSYLEAGLPNAEGQIKIVDKSSGANAFTDAHISNSIVTSGALSVANSGVARQAISNGGDATTDMADILNFNARNSNPVFGNADTVQPPSIVGMWLIVAFGVAHNIGEADVANVMQAVEQVQTGLNNVESKLPSDMTDYIVESYHNSTTWYEAYKSGKIRQGGIFSASASGWNTITFSKAFADINYVVLGNYGAKSEYMYSQFLTSSKTVTSVQLNGVKGTQMSWVAEGQGV